MNSIQQQKFTRHSFSVSRALSLALALALAALVGLLPAGAVFAAGPVVVNPGQASYFDENGVAVGDGDEWVVKLLKEAAESHDTAGNVIPNEFDITLSVETKDKEIIRTRDPKLDIVMAIDLSGSMDKDNFGTPAATDNQRWESMKEAAKRFIDGLLPASGELDNRISIVGYAGGSYYIEQRGNFPVGEAYNKLQYKMLSGWTDSAEAANSTYYNATTTEQLRGTNAYDPAYLHQDTNSQAGFYAADEILDTARPEAFKYVIYMSDGLATSYYTKTDSRFGVAPTSLPNGNVYISNNIDSVNRTDPADGIAVVQSGLMKENHPDARLITVGLDLPNGGKVLQTGAANNPYVDKYYPATSDSINEIYDEIAELIAFETRPWMVSDEMSEYVDYLGMVGNDNFTEYLAGSSTLEWNVLQSYLADEGEGLYSRTYRVRLNGDAVEEDWGSAANPLSHLTNGATTLTFFLQEENGTWNPSHTVDFDVPSVRATLSRIIYRNEEGTLDGQAEFLDLAGDDAGWVSAPVATHNDDGYDFIGWQTEDGTLVDGDGIPAVFPNEDLVLEAVWNAKDSSYTVDKTLVSVNGVPGKPADGVKIGDAIEYKVVVTNTGNMQLVISDVTDTLYDEEIIFDTLVLAPGGTATATYTYIVVAEDIVDGKVSNNVSVWIDGKDDPGDDGEEVDAEDPEYTVDKTLVSVNGVAGKPANGVKIGDVIAYEVIVTNTGEVPLDITGVTDTLVDGVAFDRTNLLPGEIAIAEYTYTVVEEDIVDGKVSNNVSVTVDRVDDPIDDGEEVDVEKPAPQFVVDKTVVTRIPAAGFKVGAAVTYRVRVTNTGVVPFAIIDVQDSLVDNVVFNRLNLRPGQVATAAYTYRVAAEDIVDGNVANNVSVWIDGIDEPGTDNALIPVEEQISSYSVDKRVITRTPIGGFKVGATVIYQVRVTNTGSVPLAITGVEDTLVANVALNRTYLLPGQAAVASYAYRVAAEDIVDGKVINNVSVWVAGQDDPMTDSEEIEVEEQISSYTVDKRVITRVPAAGFKVGATVLYQVRVTNTGSTRLTITDVEDSLVNAVAFNRYSLLPTQTAIATYSYRVAAADVVDGVIVNTVKVYMDGSDTPREDSETIPVEEQIAKYAVDKTVVSRVPAAGVKIGDTITYRVRVTNTGTVPLTITDVVDTLVDNVTFNRTYLLPGQAAIATYTYRVAEEDIVDGMVRNNVKVYVDGSDTPNEDDEEVKVDDPAPEYTVDKSLVTREPAGGFRVGDTVTYMVRVRNTGDITIAITNVVDTLVENVTFNVTTLAPGASTTATYSYVIAADDVVDGQVTNNVKVYVNNDNDNPGEDEVTIDIEEREPVYTVVKDVVGRIPAAGFRYGDMVVYRVRVQNIGEVPLTITNVEDSLVSDVPFNRVRLAPQQTSTATYVYTVAQEDVVGNAIINTVKVYANDDTDNPMEDSAEIPVETPNADYSVEKRVLSRAPANGFKIGDTVMYQIRVQNTGNTTLEITNVEDTIFDGVEFDRTVLAPGYMAYATYSYSVAAEDVVDNKVTNTVRVYVDGDTENPREDTAVIDVEAQLTSYTVEKNVLGSIPAEGVSVGDTVMYQVRVQNTGNTTIEITDVEDSLVDVVTFDRYVLAPGQIALATYPYVVTQEDSVAGVIRNNVKVYVNNTDDPGEDDEVVIVKPTKPLYTVEKNIISRLSIPETASIGETIQYEVIVRNTGTTAFTITRAPDTLLRGDVQFENPTVEPGGFTRAIYTYVAASEDVVDGRLTNVVSVYVTNNGDDFESDSTWVWVAGGGLG